MRNCLTATFSTACMMFAPLVGSGETMGDASVQIPSPAACVRACPDGAASPKRLWNGISPLVKEWELGKRAETLAWFEENQFGKTPCGRLPDEVIGASSVSFTNAGLRIEICCRLPVGADAAHPVPVFLFGDHRGGRKAPDYQQETYEGIPTNSITARGYAYVRWNFNDICPNVSRGASLDRWPVGILSYLATGDSKATNVVRAANGWGTIGAWAWGNSRVMDWIESRPELDAKRVAVLGHSRGGKTALWTGAQDERFAMTISNGSGCGGARLGRAKDPKAETIKQILHNFPNWFCPAFSAWIDRDAELPHDADDLIRLIAPRLVYVASGSEDAWAGPAAEKAAWESAHDLYRAYGLEERMGYHCHDGIHKLRPDDWEKFMDFADVHLKTPSAADSDAIVLPDDPQVLVSFGVASDVHVLADWRDANCRDLDRQPEWLEKALRWFDALKADAVVFSGDMAHTGRIPELERFAAVWEKVFPDGRAADGRRVERLLVTGNHEIGQWPGLWEGMDDAMLRKTRLDYDREHLKATWKRLFHEDYELMWKRTVKGVVFIGCQYPLKGVQQPDIGKRVVELAADVPKDRPFFYVQHAHPARSCYGETARAAVAEEESNAALSRFPNAVALSGHSHNSLCDERSVWQGAYTSIGCGSLAEAGPCYNDVKYENGGAPYASDYARQRMKCIPQIGNDGRCCLFIEVYADRLVVKRHSLAFDEPLGEDWTIPVPARPEGEYDFDRRKAEWRPPQFPENARLTVDVCTNSPSLAGPGLAGKPCLRLRFPHALPAGRSRAFDYVVKVFAGEREIKRLHVLDREYYLPEGRVSEGEECLLGLHELPSDKALSFAVEPRNCYGTAGVPIRGFFREKNKVYEEPGWCVWCPSAVALPDGRYALVHSRWRESDGFEAWCAKSEAALAISETGPLGPYKFSRTILKGSGRNGDFDRDVVHNPQVFVDGGKYYLFYMGTFSDLRDGALPGDSSSGTAKGSFRMNQRIGVAVADRIEGPYERTGKSILPESEDCIMASNPAVVKMPNGKYLMVYKWGWPPPAKWPHCRNSCAAAVADSPLGPWKVVSKDVFPVRGAKFPGEDPCLWLEGDVICCSIHDNGSFYAASDRSLVRFESRDGVNWKNCGELFPRGRISRLERPFVLAEPKGRRLLFAASKPSCASPHSEIIAFPGILPEL